MLLVKISYKTNVQYFRPPPGPIQPYEGWLGPFAGESTLLEGGGGAPQESEPPKRVVSGWVVSGYLSFAFHLKPHV